MSSESESDDDYVPEEQEKLSEEESADDETDLQYENEQEQKTNKRKLIQTKKGKKKIKTIASVKNIIEEEAEKQTEIPISVSVEEEKKREDDLWAKFLEGTDTKPKTVTKEINPESVIKDDAKKKIVTKDVAPDDKEREKRIFEFAGETIVVENHTIKERIKTSDSSPKVCNIGGPSRSRGGGLSNLIGQLNKNNKLSTLEKSKLDWNTYKKEEGVEDEIVNHNKGKAGYLDRRDFLERTDVRQYEIERDLRMSRRSNR